MCDLCGPDPAHTTIDHSIKHPFELKPDSDNECLECGQHLAAHPDKFEYLRRREAETINKDGHMVRVVFPSEDGTAFAYSVGRTTKGRPELLATGNLHPDMLGYLINEVAEIDDEKPLEAGNLLDQILKGYSVKIVKVRDLDEAGMRGAIRYGATSALQVLWPDTEGRFPDSPDYDSAAQPVFA